ncbi:alpha/beta fold hydrolase [Mycolicibacterium sp. CBM1]
MQFRTVRAHRDRLGVHDTAIFLRFGRATQRAIAGSRLEVFDSGHLPLSSLPEPFVGVVETFLAAINRV